MLEAKNLCLTYKDSGQNNEVIKNVSLKIEPGEFVVLLGPSGSGKSSLIYLLSLLKKPTLGKIMLDGREVDQTRDNYKIRYENYGFIFQQNFLIPYLNVLENVCKATYKKKDTINKALDILQKLGLNEYLYKKPYQLSGGQRQRVSIARALVKSPKYIFADEPTAALDHNNALIVMDILKDISKQSAIVCSTHDTSILPKNARILHLTEGTLQ